MPGVEHRDRDSQAYYLFHADFNAMYELFDDCTTMFFYRNKHILVDLGE